MIIYQGPSMLDGKPIVVLATEGSRNSKTGPMIQTWIMRSDVAPNDAKRSGADVSVCGNCKLRDNGCYVVVHQGPLSTWRRFKRGGHAVADPGDVGEGKDIRLGSYGDLAAVPFEVWERLVSKAKGWTGYTHQWRNLATDSRLMGLVMASVDTPQERGEAQRMGWRTFRVKLPHEDRATLEISCPASSERGHKLTCSQCKACNGNATGRKGSVAINAHGFQTSKYNRLRVA